MRALALTCLVMSSLACSGSKPAPPATSGEATATSSGDAPAASEGGAADAPAGSDGAAPAPAGEAASDAAPAGSGSEHEELARDLVKRGGRKIGWSAQKKSFVIPRERQGSDGWSLDVIFTDDGGRQTSIQRICQPSECAEQMKELAQKAVPEIASKLEAGGYVSIRAIGWPSRDELEVSQLGLKLKYAGGRLEAIREGKPPARLGSVGSGSPKVLAIFVVPDSKLLAGFAAPDGDVGRQEFFVVRLP